MPEQRDKPIAQLVDPQGFRIVVTEETWRHVLDGHPELGTDSEKVWQAITNPDFIVYERRSHLCFCFDRLSREGKDIYMVVVVSRHDEGGEMKTAFYTGLGYVQSKKERGIVIWQKI